MRRRTCWAVVRAISGSLTLREIGREICQRRLPRLLPNCSDATEQDKACALDSGMSQCQHTAKGIRGHCARDRALRHAERLRQIAANAGVDDMRILPAGFDDSGLIV